MFAHAPKIYAFAVQDRQTQVSNFSSDNQGGNSIMKKFMAVLAMAVMVAFAAPAFAATNPFMDVPQGHWSYDAVGLLASRGIVSGYPDGAFKGAQPATRYEMASVVARALVTVDAEKASKQDLELLKKLVMEFKDELDALGVKVDSLDKRVAVLEEGLGGWQLGGTFTFDAKFGDSDNGSYLYSEYGQKNEFEKDQFRLYLTKNISEDTYFFAEYRTGGDGAGGGHRPLLRHRRLPSAGGRGMPRRRCRLRPRPRAGARRSGAVRHCARGGDQHRQACRGVAGDDKAVLRRWRCRSARLR